MTTMQTPIAAESIPATAHREATDLALEQYLTLADELDALEPAHWAAPTPCTAWTVREIAAHVAGSCDGTAHVGVMLRHVRTAKRRYADRAPIDGLNQAQVDDRAGLEPAALVEELRTLAAKSCRSRRRAPGFVRALRLPETGALPPRSSFGYLIDIVLPRDTWMHRLDVADSVGRTIAWTAGEAEIVTQVIADLADVWTGPTINLTLVSNDGLTSHATGPFQLGEGSAPQELTLDARQFCRLLSGRAHRLNLPDGLDEGLAERILATRVFF